MAYQLKLTRNGETRRLIFDAQPTWNTLQARISSLFRIRPDGVAVSYEDSDGDVVTMSSQEELLDYFQNCYKPSQIAKFAVIDKAQSQRPRVDDAEDIDAQSDGDLPTMGPTMFIEVDDGGWQRLPRMPGLYGIREEGPQTLSQQGAFVEVVDSDSEDAEKDINNTSPGRISPRQSRYKGKEKAALSKSTASVSSVSVFDDDDDAAKPSVHVYDVSDAGESLRGQHEVGQQKSSSAERTVRPFGTVYPASPPQDAFKAIPRASEYFDARRPKEHDGFTSVGSDLSNSAVPPLEDLQSLDLESNIRGNNDTVGSRTPTLGQAPTLQPSFVHDVASLVNNLTRAFASHPELSEGVRNIVRNAVGGRYWNTERERMASVTDNVRAAAEEASTRISESVGNMANNAEQDAVRVIAEALGGVFRVIGELSRPMTEPPTADVPRGGPEPPLPQPQHLHGSYPTRLDRRDFNAPLGRHDRLEDATRYVPLGANVGYPSGMKTSRPPYSREFGPEIPQSQTNGTWIPGSQKDRHVDGRMKDDSQGATSRSNIHETKATLEAAKRIYKAEKERFRAEKEERRKMRREVAERRAEANRIQRPDGTIREEEIVAHLPLFNPSRGGHPPRPYSGIYKQANSSNVRAGIHRPFHAPPPPATNLPHGMSGISTSVYSAEEHMSAVPPAPVPAPVTVSPVPPASVVPPPPMVRPVPGLSNNVNPALDAPQTRNFGPGPFPWPVPPVRDPSRRKHLSTLRERIQARLFDMGITPASQPDMQDILNICTSRTDAPEDDEVLADVLSAMNIRGSPSPRAGTSALPR